MQKSKLRAAEEVFLVAFFLAAVAVPLALLVARGEGGATSENRRLAELPPRPKSLREVYRLPPKLSEYFKDHFGLRTELIRWQAEAKMNWLRSSGSPQVLLGKDGWLFHAGEGEVEMFTGSEPFDAEGLARWARFLEATADWAGRRGASFVVTFVPEKQTVYPELMPDGLTRARRVEARPARRVSEVAPARPRHRPAACARGGEVGDAGLHGHGHALEPRRRLRGLRRPGARAREGLRGRAAVAALGV